MTHFHCQGAFQRGVNRWAFDRRSSALRLVAAGITWAFLCALSASAQSKPSEYQVKAAYLYNFGKFIEWPTTVAVAKGDAFTICVLGQDPFGPALNTTLADGSVNGQNVVARRIPSPQEAVNCRVLFISSSEDKRLKEILTSLGTASILTVSDLPNFAQRGGMVQFILEGNKVRFEVNSSSAERAGLTLSSELLKVAANVRRNVQLGD